MKGLSIEERQRRSAAALSDIYWSRPARRTLPRGDQGALFDFAADYIGPDVPVTCLEFGVGRGVSIGRLAGAFTSRRSRFVGFDSFAAPPAGGPVAMSVPLRGTYATDGHPPAMADTRVTFVKGWFQDTVPAYLRTNPLDRTRIPLVHFDADLYGSDLFLLTTLWHATGSYFFIFDDFLHDDAAALADFMRAYPVAVEFIAQTRGGGDRPYPARVFGHLRRADMAPPTH